MTLHTERTTLRPLTTEDYDAAHRWASDPETVKFMDWGPNLEEDTRRFLSDCEKTGPPSRSRNTISASCLRKRANLSARARFICSTA